MSENWKNLPVEKKLELMSKARDYLEEKLKGLENRLIEERKKVDSLQIRVKFLEERNKLLEALEAAGVDNWEGYEIALENC